MWSIFEIAYLMLLPLIVTALPFALIWIWCCGGSFRSRTSIYDTCFPEDSESDSESELSDPLNEPFKDLHQERSQLRRSPRLSYLYKHNYPYVLIIIDMQDQFATSRNQQTNMNVKKLITQAIRDKAFIIAAHYMRFGKTRPELLSMFKDYEHKAYCYADKDDKSGAIHTKIIKHHIRTDTFKICGVNTDACVKRTVQGLVDLYPNIHLIVSGKACNCTCLDSHVCDGNNIGKYPNVSFTY